MQCAGRLSGFTVCDADGKPLAAVYDQEIDSENSDTVILWVTHNAALGLEVPRDAALFYGWGHTPHCNLTDDEDMGVPAFGLFPIARPEDS